MTPLPTGATTWTPPPAVFPPGKLLPGWTATLGRSWCRFWILSTPPTTWPKPWPLRGPAGTVIVADSQTGGRGRMGRALSPPGGGSIPVSHSPAGGAAGGADAPDLRRGRGALRRDRSCLRPASRDQVDQRPGIRWPKAMRHSHRAVSGGRERTCAVRCGGGRRQLRPDSLRFSTGDSGYGRLPVYADRQGCEPEHPGGRDDPSPQPSGWGSGGEPAGVDGPVPPGLCHHRPGRQREPGGRNPVGGKRWTWTTGALFWWISARGRRPSSPAKSVYAVCMGTYNVFI